MAHMGTGGQLRSAVIGCGAIGQVHLAHLASSPLVELVAVCDRSAAAARYAQERYGAERRYADATELLDSCEVDVVHILTPPHTHVGLVSAAIERRFHAICEKPLAPTAGEVRRLLDLAARAGTMLVESRNFLFNDPVVAIDRFIASGEAGTVREVDLLLSLDLTAGAFGDPNLTGPGVHLPGGAVHDHLPHLSSLLLHFAGRLGPVRDVTGTLGNLSGNTRVGFDHLDALVSVGEVRGRIRVASDLTPDAFRLTVRGTSASLETDLYNPFLRVQGARYSGKLAPVEQLVSGCRLAWSLVGNLKNKVTGHDPYHGMARMLDATYEAVRLGRPSPISPDEIEAVASLNDRLVELGVASS